MRVTANTFPDSLVTQLNNLATQQNRLQNQAATGQRIQLPEDDPSAMRRVMDLQTESKALQQYRSNIATLQEQSNASFAVIKQLKQVSDRAGEIATLADGIKSPLELKTYATEISQLIQAAVQYANSQHHGDYMFAGTKSNTPPFAATMDSSGQITGVTYQGNDQLAHAEIAKGVTVAAFTVGANTTGSGPRGLISDSRTGADFFQHLIDLQKHLQAGDTKSISAQDQAQLAKDEDNFLYHVGETGATQSRLNDSATIHQNRGQSIETLVSKEVDADMAQTLVRLNESQTAYKAALQSGSTMLQISLLDFLR
ncbi:MAG: hypothetical protein HY043_03015 [Verrucomicrobia bacterium]|nr:hypothetical protein [Verrucomicrobiota bacterium]